MFYADFILTKRAPLGRVWLAAHWDRRLNKAQIVQVDLQESVRNIIEPSAPLALRLSGQLLLGVVRIYSRKAKYLLDDCTDALTKLKMAFRSSMQDMPTQAAVAHINAITLPENLTDLDMFISDPRLNISFSSERFNMLTSRPEEINLQEKSILRSFPHFDQEFGSLEGFGAADDEELANTQNLLLQQPIEMARRGTLSSPLQLIEPHSPGKARTLSPLDSANGVLPALTFDDDDGGYFGGADGHEMGDLPFDTLPLLADAAHPSRRVTRKRRPAVDSDTEISKRTLQEQLKDTSDLVCEPTQVTNDMPLWIGSAATTVAGSKRVRLTLNDIVTLPYDVAIHASSTLAQVFASLAMKVMPSVDSTGVSLLRAGQMTLEEDGAVDFGDVDDMHHDDLREDALGMFMGARDDRASLDGSYFGAETLDSSMMVPSLVTATTKWTEEKLYEKLKAKESVVFDELLEKRGRREAAQCFFDVLVLKTDNMRKEHCLLHLEQPVPFGVIRMSMKPEVLAF